MLARVLIAIGLTLLGLPATVWAEGAEAPAAADANHGKYVFQTALCAGCHGQDLGGWRGGGTAERFEGPFGTVLAANISQDKETGIGSWTDAQIIDAIRNGKSVHSHELFPIMPFLRFHGMSDQDVADLVAFLRTLPAVSNMVAEHQLNGPVPPLPRLTPSPATAPTSGVPRGAYLVQSVSICGDCHTPMTPSGASDESRQRAGGFIPREGGKFEIAPNITPDQATGIGSWSEQDIVRLLKTGQRPAGRPPVTGLMHLIIENPPWGGVNQYSDADRLRA